MITDKKTTGAGVWGGAATGGENTLYTAHKVHTLAQIVFQQLAGNWTNRTPWNGLNGFGVPQPYPVVPGQGVSQAASPRPDAWGSAMAQGAPPPPLFYWYP